MGGALLSVAPSVLGCTCPLLARRYEAGGASGIHRDSSQSPTSGPWPAHIERKYDRYLGRAHCVLNQRVELTTGRVHNCPRRMGTRECVERPMSKLQASYLGGFDAAKRAATIQAGFWRFSQASALASGIPRVLMWGLPAMTVVGGRVMAARGRRSRGDRRGKSTSRGRTSFKPST